MKKFFSLIAAVLFAGSMMAIDFTLSSAESVTQEGVTVTFAKGSGSTAPAWYDNGLRLYASNEVTISSESNITGITFNWQKQGTKAFNTATASVGEYTHPEAAGEGVWTGSATSVTFTLGTSGQLLLNTFSVTLEGSTPVVTDTYTVAGNDAAIFGEAWNPALATNDMQKVNGIYKWEKAQLNLAVGSIEFKVAKNHSWDIAYPAQNYVVNIAEAGEYTLTITFDPATETVAAEAVKKVIPKYEVAEAIAAGLTDNTEILVRGIITKMEFKGVNFAKYGSVNVYVADATGAEGVFEFYNCYSLNADTFRTSTPAYDAQSTAWVEFEEVADENGNAIHVGDTVIAFGKYKLYSGTHELNTGCYLTEIKHPGDAPVEDDDVIYDWTGEIGTTVLGATGVEVSTVKIHTNTDAFPAIKFGSSYVYSEGKYIAIKPAEGGFKAGDVLSVSVVFNNADDTKYAQIDLRAADGDTRIWLSDSASTINGRTQAGEPIVQTYTLAADQDSLLLGRYGNTAMFVTLLKVTRALVPPTPQPTINYYVIGSMTEWNVEANYKLVANPAVEGEYMGEFTFANNDEFKIVGDDGSQLIWFPGGVDNNFKITEAGDYKITFNPAGNVEGWYEGFFNVVKKEIPVIPQYEVAEAIAAGLAEGDEVLVRGVISKMQIKGKNFAKYGSVNIYVTDATDAEGEFEFFNCFSFNADTFRTTTPAYDAEGTTWDDLKKVVDENGNEFRLGDTIVAFGKYKLYNTTHELTACYITDLKPAPVAPAQDIEVNMSEGLRFVDYVAAEGWWELYGADDKYIIDLSNVSTEQIAGEYPIDNLDPNYCYLGIINGEDTTYVSFVAGAITLTVSENGDVTVTGTLVGDDDNNYVLNLAYIVPTPQETVNVSIANGESYDEYAEYGLYVVYGEDENEVYVQLAIWAENGFEGNFTEEDLDGQYVGSFLYDGEEAVEIYSATITVTPGNGGDYNVTATILGYNNKQYNVTMYVPGGEGIEETLAAGKAAKVLRDGQVLILKGDKTFNVMGARIR